MPVIDKRGVFDSTTGATIGGAIIVVVGVLIGLGCALIAVCGFPWNSMFARHSRMQDLGKGKEDDTNYAVDTTLLALPPPTPSPHPNMPLWHRAAVPGDRRP